MARRNCAGTRLIAQARCMELSPSSKLVDHLLFLQRLEQSEALNSGTAGTRMLKMADFRFLLDFDEDDAIHRTGGEHRGGVGSDIH